jgi:hypothetical protein
LATKMHSVAKGKRSELYVMAILLENGFKVFQTLADTEGIDCVIMGQGNKFYPIQIKSRTDFIGGDIVSIWQFADDMFIIIYDTQTRKYWVVPYDVYQTLSRKQYLKDGTPNYRLSFTKKNRDKLARYEGEKGIEVLRSRVYPITS